MKLALLAGLAMFLQDVAGVVMMQFEAHSLTLQLRRPFRRYWQDWVGGGWKAWAAAWLDEASWIVGITTTTISVTAFAGHSWSEKLWVGLFVSAGNLLGSRTGQNLGVLLLQHRGHQPRPPRPHPERLAELELRAAGLEAWARTVGYRPEGGER